MSGAMVDIGRLNIALHGISAEIGEAAVGGLEAALRRRLGALRASLARDVPALRVDALDLPPGTDAASLRELIADRLFQAIGDTLGPDQEEDS